MAAKRRGPELFESLREVMGSMSEPEGFGVRLFEALTSGERWSSLPPSVRAALTEIAERYEARMVG